MSLSVTSTPNDYKAESLYSMIFYRMLPDSPDKAEMLSGLGLPASDVAYSGTHAYTLGAPVVADPQWRKDFVDRVTYRNLAIFYLRNLPLTWHLLGRELKEDAPRIRPVGFGNFEREDGFPPGAMAHRFDAWSNLRSWLLRVFPAHMVMFYGVMDMASLLCLFRPAWAARWPQYPLVMLLAASGQVEFLFAVLLDGTETARHLFFFHVITEILIVYAVAAILSQLAYRYANVPSSAMVT
jgi:hypothetical protein